MEFGILPEIQNIGFYCGDPKIAHKFTGDTINIKVLLGVTLILPLILVSILYYEVNNNFYDVVLFLPRQLTFLVSSSSLAYVSLQSCVVVLLIKKIIKNNFCLYEQRICKYK